MAEPSRFSLASARQAAARDRLAQWVGEFLASEGSDNGVLAAALALEPHVWVGPVAVPLTELERLAGPEEHTVCPIPSDEWEAEIGAMAEQLEGGWEPPPLLAEYREGRLLLQDGNHRYETLRAAGATHAWTVVWFPDERTRNAWLRRSDTFGA